MTGNKIFALGDIHGKWQHIRDFHLRIKTRYDFSETRKHTLILLGDAGLNYFFNERDDKIKEKLGDFPYTYFVIRGNHEERPCICMDKNPDEWHIEEYWGNVVYVENKYPYIKYALDGAAIYRAEVDNKTYSILSLPGAYSIDKFYRLQNGWSWFEFEQMTPWEREQSLRLIEQYPSVDIVLSHTCPIIFEPTDLFLSFIDQSTVDKTMERLLGEIEYQLDYKAWLWGHYHAFRDYPRNDGKKKLMLFDNDAIDVIEYLEKDEVKKL